MKPEEQRIAIAEACGWVLDNKGAIREDGYRYEVWGKHPHEALPDYLNSLDAMHKAVETLRGKAGPEWFDFQRLLMIECGSWMNCIQASAAQRAEAFLKTLSLWKDEN